MDYTKLSDEDLVEVCRGQLPYNTEGFTALVTRFEPRVFDTCARYLGNESDAEEIAQNVFLKVFHSLKNFEGRSSFRTWIFRIATNECASRYRARKRQLERRDAYARQVNIDHHTIQPHPPATNTLDLGGPIGSAWQSLAETDRAILSLRHIAELSIAEAAETLGLGLSAAKMRLYRAEDRLRQAYEDHQKRM